MNRFLRQLLPFASLLLILIVLAIVESAVANRFQSATEEIHQPMARKEAA